MERPVVTQLRDILAAIYFNKGKPIQLTSLQIKAIEEAIKQIEELSNFKDLFSRPRY